MGEAARESPAEFLKAAMRERLNLGVAIGRGRLGEPRWQRDAERNTEEKVAPFTAASNMEALFPVSLRVPLAGKLLIVPPDAQQAPHHPAGIPILESPGLAPARGALPEQPGP